MVRRSKITIILLLPTAVAIFLIGLIIQSVGSAGSKPKINRSVVPRSDGIHFGMLVNEEQQIRQ